MTHTPFNPDENSPLRPAGDWLDALLHAQRPADAPPVPDDGFSLRMLQQIDRWQAARASPPAASMPWPAAALDWRARQRAAARRGRWACGGALAGAVVAGGTLAVVGGVPVAASWWPVAVAVSTAGLGWALLRDSAG